MKKKVELLKKENDEILNEKKSKQNEQLLDCKGIVKSLSLFFISILCPSWRLKKVLCMGRCMALVARQSVTDWSSLRARFYK
jgi:hypothetical protein